MNRAAIFTLVALLQFGCATAPTPPAADAKKPAAVPALSVPVDYYKLSNGLRVVLSEDHSVPVASIGIYYNIGFRIEPKDRTGFAHLFEHLMFQGSQNLAKGQFFKLVQGLGGTLNGSTRFDFTNYYEAFPSNALETMLWAEGDRMRSLDITQENLENQQGVVKEEVKVNVLNRPYGGFPWLQLPQYANTNWYNAHNFYGDLQHIDAATLEEARTFFRTYYVPGNAVLVVAGDFDPAQAKKWIEQYFSTIPAAPVPAIPDVSEPRQTAEKQVSYTDALAPRPALAIGYHVPPRWTPEHFAFGLIDEILLQGESSRLHRDLVQKRGFTDSVSGGINLLGNMFNYSGPMLWSASLLHDPTTPQAEIMGAFDENVERLRTELVTQDELDRARRTIRSQLYDIVGSSTRLGLIDLLACFALFDDDPSRINHIEAEFAKVTPELVRKTAQEYLRRDNRTVMTLTPGKATQNQGAAQ
ncbi:putative Zn-dependent peptidase [Povalibacter uvarum]|uniref:Putative Zn-dependent peptidase n=1 Tax=Povalibacter uvarum TaxID=732238 RepID=A0A841HQ10_9GAMM|nr:pitrilysin family protein [Povalibacter uvarum]MBB6094419.1 putative Zn-dependent peptidase [Povalibacter uvarum]